MRNRGVRRDEQRQEQGSCPMTGTNDRTAKGFRAAFVGSIDLNGETINGFYWPENGGVRVSYKNAAGETRRGWADVSSAPSASQAMARIVLHELAQEKIEPPTSQIIELRLCESLRPRLPSLRKIIGAMEGVLTVTCHPQTNSLTAKVRLSDADRVAKAMSSAVDASEDEFVAVVRFVEPAPRKPEFRTA
jgi:hypothetical protein